MIKRTKQGFTLAEVLVVIGIIGIIANMTIPSLIASYQKTVYITGLKKAYVEITEALKLMAIDSGCSGDLRCTGAFGLGNNVLGNEFKKYLKIAKDCGTTYVVGDEKTKCISSAISFNYDGTTMRSDYNASGWYGLITADGFSIILTSLGGNCINNQYSLGAGSNLSQICGLVYFDVNGLKGPNNAGRDLFGFWITNGKGPALYPYGGSELTNSGNGWLTPTGTQKSCTDKGPGQDLNGWRCTGRVMDQGWQMLY